MCLIYLSESNGHVELCYLINDTCLCSIYYKQYDFIYYMQIVYVRILLDKNVFEVLTYTVSVIGSQIVVSDDLQIFQNSSRQKKYYLFTNTFVFLKIDFIIK